MKQVTKTVKTAIGYASTAAWACGAYPETLASVLRFAEDKMGITIDGNADSSSWLLSVGGAGLVITVLCVGLYRSGAPSWCINSARKVHRGFFGHEDIKISAEIQKLTDTNVRFFDLARDARDAFLRGGSREEGLRARMARRLADPSCPRADMDKALRCMLNDYFDDLDGSPPIDQALVAAFVSGK